MDWIAFVLSMGSQYYSGLKDPKCWFFSTSTQLIFIYINIRLQLWGLVAMSLVHLVMNVRNWRLWTSEK